MLRRRGKSRFGMGIRRRCIFGGLGKPLAAARAVIWASLVDDPSGDPSLSPAEQDVERERLFRILERLVKWENSNNPDVLAEGPGRDRPVLPRRTATDPGSLRRGRGHTAGGPAARAHRARRGPEPCGGAHQQGHDRESRPASPGLPPVHPDIDKDPHHLGTSSGTGRGREGLRTMDARRGPSGALGTCTPTPPAPTVRSSRPSLGNGPAP